MSSRKTIQLAREGKSTVDLPADLVGDTRAERSLTLVHPAKLAPVTAPTGLATHTSRHTRCRCLRCRRRRAQKRAAQRSGHMPQNALYTEGVIISITEETAPLPLSGYVAPQPDEPENSPTTSVRVDQRTAASHHAKAPVTAGASHPVRVGRQAGTRHRKRRAPLFLAAALLLLCAVAFAWYSGAGSALLTQSSAPQATITIIPRTDVARDSISITAVTGRAYANQVAARKFSATSPASVVTAMSSGTGQTSASTSQGTIFFYNGSPTAQTVRAGTSLTGADGITVVTGASVTVPPGNPPATYGTAQVGAQSVQAGSQANIAAGDIEGLCCASGISVKNNTAFSGGQDAQHFQVLEQRDIDAAAGTVDQGLAQQAQRLVVAQVPAAQQLAGTPQCHVQVSAADAVASRVAQTSVRVSATCSVEAFDRADARHAAASLFARGVVDQLGTNYKLVSGISIAIGQVTVSDARRGTLAIFMQAQGTWSYQFSPGQRLALARRIEGKPVSDALTLIAREPGVQHTSVQVSAGAQAIPSDTNRITIVILQVAGGS